MDIEKEKPILSTIVLHVCCGVCASWPIQKLREDGHVPIGYFYNPNIYPKEEYSKRLSVARKVAELLEFELLDGPFDSDDWFLRVKGLEDEEEGGKRCDVCFKARLEATNKKIKELGIPYFTTTLSVSPHKDHKMINRIGRNLNSDAFLSYDFKNDNGFSKSNDFAKQHSLYCQNYCGCKFSFKNKT